MHIGARVVAALATVKVDSMLLPDRAQVVAKMMMDGNNGRA
jgi:hypothetical protein